MNNPNLPADYNFIKPADKIQRITIPAGYNPNEVTEEAIKQAEKGIGLKKFHKLEDLFDDLRT